MATLEQRVSPDGSIAYRVKIRRKGHPTISKSFKLKSKAKEYIHKVESEINQGSYLTNTESTKKTLNEAIDRYIKFILPNKPRCQKQQTAQLTWWKHQIGHLRLVQVNPAVLVECREYLLNKRTKTGTAPLHSTVNRYFAALSHLMTIACKEWGWVASNPCRKVTRLQEPRGRVRFLEEKELKRLLEACEASSNPYLYTVVTLALGTGARKNEIMGLTRDDIDLHQNIVIFRDTKNKSTRSVPLRGDARIVILNLLKTPKLHTKLLFPSNSLPNQPYDIRKAWERAIRVSEIDNFVFHDLRHTAASYLAMSGASLIEIAEILGHKTLSMVQRYSHLNKDHLNGVIDRMNARMHKN